MQRLEDEEKVKKIREMEQVMSENGESGASQLIVTTVEHEIIREALATLRATLELKNGR